MLLIETPLSSKSEKYSFLRSEEGRNNLLTPENDFEDPQVVCERLGLKDSSQDFINNSSLVGISTQGAIWEYYILGLFSDELNLKNVYKKIRGAVKDYEPYPGCNRGAVGNSKYPNWESFYKNRIQPSLTQKKKMFPFAKAIVYAAKPLRAKHDDRITNLRLNAAEAFQEYLKSNFFTLRKTVKVMLEKKYFDEQLMFLFSLENFSKEYLLKMSLLLCLYGRNRQAEGEPFYVSSKFVGFVADQLAKCTVNDVEFKNGEFNLSTQQYVELV